MTELPIWDENETLEFVSLVAGQQSFCIEITQIREIRRWTPVTSLPYAEASVLGVMNLRGAVIPIMDLAVKLGLPSSEPSERDVVIVVSVNSRTIGLLVESVAEIVTVKGGDIRETPAIARGEGTKSIIGLVSLDEVMSRVLDLSQLIPAQVEEVA